MSPVYRICDDKFWRKYLTITRMKSEKEIKGKIKIAPFPGSIKNWRAIKGSNCLLFPPPPPPNKYRTIPRLCTILTT